ncbi:ATP-binding protein, partial [Patescibacteria group bacterium]|nr:ATP-binding protein [Patescibacteria group bacterium]
METNWYIITGGPSSGKTTVIENLSSLGYATVPESARVVIDTEIGRGKTIEEVRADEAAFQEKILQIKIENEEKTPSEQLTFFDRGIPDSVAYYHIAKQDVAPVIQASQKRRYKDIFLLEQISFKKDYARTEDQEQADVLAQLLYDAYTNLNYAVIRVPLMS